MLSTALLAQPCCPAALRRSTALPANARLAPSVGRRAPQVFCAAAPEKPPPAGNGAVPVPAPKAAAPVAKKKAKKDPNRPFTNTQKFIVPAAVQPAFEAEWKAREAGMQSFEGFNGFQMKKEGEAYTVVSDWARIPDWEVYNLSDVARRSHMPNGIWQLVPKLGEGFPEDFVPFERMDTFVNAKYK